MYSRHWTPVKRVHNDLKTGAERLNVSAGSILQPFSLLLPVLSMVMDPLWAWDTPSHAAIPQTRPNGAAAVAWKSVMQ
jgi:hypothetical protein